MEAYVYAVFVDGIVRYIGKGRGKRLFDHERIARSIGRETTYRPSRFHRKLAEAIEAGAAIEARKLVCGVTDALALEIERGAIGGIRKGQLWNVRRGGSPGITSEEAKRIQSDPDRRRAQSERAKLRWRDPDLREMMLSRQAEALARIPAGAASDRVKALFRDHPDYARRNRERWLDPDFRERHRAGVAASITKEKASQFGDRVSASWRDPVKREARLEAKRERDRGRHPDTFEGAVLAAIQQEPGITTAGLTTKLGGRRVAAATHKLLGKKLIEKRGGKCGRFYAL